MRGRVLREPEFRAVLAAQGLAMLAIVCADVALAVQIHTRTGSPLLTAATFAVGFVPMGVGAVLLGGVGRDRPARDVLVACEALTALVVAGIAVPGAPIAVQLTLLGVQGLIAPVFSGTRAATLPELVGDTGYPPARSVLRLVSQNAQLLGFAAGGVALTVVAPTHALLAAAVGHAAAAVVLVAGTRRRTPTPRATRPGTVRCVPGPVLAMFWLPVFFAVAPAALAVPYADSLDAGPAAAGLLLAAGPVGSMLGELLGSRLAPERRERWLRPLGVLWCAPAVGFALTPPPPVATALLVLAGVGIAHLQGLDQVSLRVVPADVRREGFALVHAGQMTTQGLGFAAAGAAAEHLAPSTVIPVAGVCGVLAVIIVTGRLRRHVRSPTGT